MFVIPRAVTESRLLQLPVLELTMLMYLGWPAIVVRYQFSDAEFVVGPGIEWHKGLTGPVYG